MIHSTSRDLIKNKYIFKVSYAHQGYIYMITNTVKTETLQLKTTVFYNFFLHDKASKQHLYETEI